ncbi:FAD/NAD(P)-binding protein [Mesorhizobium sp.]|uniref:FAD/NAD(P)-binding protein n=1 Tax=Mesorhizobium sp. TaxID=1871066 RepID=UPI00338E9C09
MAAHLLRSGNAGLEVTIVEKRASLGRGLAYSTDLPEHVLNVRAANMSAFADDPDHFARWLKARSIPSMIRPRILPPVSSMANILESC